MDDSLQYPQNSVAKRRGGSLLRCTASLTAATATGSKTAATAGHVHHGEVEAADFHEEAAAEEGAAHKEESKSCERYRYRARLTRERI